MDATKNNPSPLAPAAGRVGAGNGALLVRAREAGKLCGVSERCWRRWNAAGLIPAPRHVGGAVLWQIEELTAWAAAGCPARAEWQRRKGGEP